MYRGPCHVALDHSPNPAEAKVKNADIGSFISSGVDNVVQLYEHPASMQEHALESKENTGCPRWRLAPGRTLTSPEWGGVSRLAQLLVAALLLTLRPGSAPCSAAPQAEFTPLNLAAQQKVAWEAFRPYRTWTPPLGGRQRFHEVPFEITGVIQMASARELQDGGFLPTRLTIPVNQPFTALHLLHFAEFTSPHGQANALAIFHYQDGQEQAFPLRYGVHYFDWHNLIDSDTVTHPNTDYAWAMFPLRQPNSRLLAAIWQTALINPRPDALVSSLEIRSLLTGSKYSLAAVTLEQGRQKQPLPDQSYDGRPYPPQRQMMEQSIRLLDAQDHTPVAGARVKAWFKSGDKTVEWGAYTTDGSGRVVLDLPSASRLALDIVAVGAQHAATRFTQLPGGWAGGKPERAEAVFKMPRGRRVGGIVRDDSGKPVSGANVSISSVVGGAAPGGFVLCEWPNVQTDSAGKWSIGAAPEHLKGLTICVEHPDFLSATCDLAEQTGSANPIREEDLLAGKAAIKLEPGLQLAGAVKEANGKALSSARVTLVTGTYANAARKTLLTGTQGEFSFRALAASEMMLAVQASGHAATLRPVKVESGMRPVDVVPPPAQPLRLRMVDEAGLPLEGAQVSPANDLEQPWFEFSALSDKSGTVTWEGAPLEAISLRILRDGYLPVLLAARPTPDLQTVRLVFNGRVTGKVIDAQTKKPVSSGRVFPLAGIGNNGVDDWQSLGGKSFGYGGFVLADLTNRGQRWKVRIEAPGYEPSDCAPFVGPTNLVFELRQANQPGVR